MNHTWKKTSKLDDECKRCGCERTKHYICGQRVYMYCRSGIVFGSERPDCIDWDVENSKTID